VVDPRGACKLCPARSVCTEPLLGTGGQLEAYWVLLRRGALGPFPTRRKPMALGEDGPLVVSWVPAPL
jgi:hypothetical protein